MGNLVNIIILISTLITAVTTIIVAIKKLLEKMFTPINQKIDDLDLGQARNYLVDFLADIENGETKDECQIERAFELYDHYTKDLKANSYIHSKWEKVMNNRKEN